MNDWINAETRAEHARDLYDEGRLAEAAAELRAAIDLNPYNPSWHFNLGLTLEAMEDYIRACEAYRAALRLKPDDIEILNCLGVNMNRQGKYSEALKHFERIEQIDPTYEPCYCNRIVSYSELSQHDKAELMFYTARLFKDACPLCCYNLGNSFFNAGQYDRAIDCWKQTLQIDPTHPQVNARIADACWTKGDLESARGYYEAELDLCPDDLDTILDYGELLMHLGKLDDAGKQFRTVLQRDHENASANFCLGEIALKRGQLQAAEKRFRRALQIDPKCPGAQARLGQVMLRRGMHAKAARHFLAEMKLCNDDPQMLHELGRLLMEARQMRQASAAFRRLVKIMPDDPDAQHSLAVACFLLGKLDEGIRHCRRAIKLQPEYPLALYNLALAHYKMGQLPRAKRYAAKALTIAPQQEEIRDLSRKLTDRGFWSRLKGLGQKLRRIYHRYKD
ncbi:MAG TPA: tetratricopeptide repeat protein [Phycisphaerae bacterium]|nr:tetratricopeptide repeat protein [Phycisphaerae bacterium]